MWITKSDLLGDAAQGALGPWSTFLHPIIPRTSAEQSLWLGKAATEVGAVWHRLRCEHKRTVLTGSR